MRPRTKLLTATPAPEMSDHTLSILPGSLSAKPGTRRKIETFFRTLKIRASDRRAALGHDWSPSQLHRVVLRRGLARVMADDSEPRGTGSIAGCRFHRC